MKVVLLVSLTIVVAGAIGCGNSGGCQKDTDCAAGRICEDHECVDAPAGMSVDMAKPTMMASCLPPQDPVTGTPPAGDVPCGGSKSCSSATPYACIDLQMCYATAEAAAANCGSSCIHCGASPGVAGGCTQPIPIQYPTNYAGGGCMPVCMNSNNTHGWCCYGAAAGGGTDTECVNANFPSGQTTGCVPPGYTVVCSDGVHACPVGTTCTSQGCC